METMERINTLECDMERCIGCGLCAVVCPHGVFALEAGRAQLVRYTACIECGACQRNCPADAITVDSGPGCATALIRAALTGGEPTCGPSGCGCDASDGDARCC